MNRIILSLALLTLPLTAQCGLYKCEKPNRTVAYSDKPCPTGTLAQAMGASVKADKSAASELNLGEEWRSPYYSESMNDTDWRTDSKDSYYKIKGDFDGDGIDDSVYLLVSRNNNESAVVAYLSTQKFIALPVYKEKGLYAITAHGLKTVAKSESEANYKVTCKSIVGGCLKKFNEEDAIANPFSKVAAIEYFHKTEKNGSIYLAWDGEEKRFYAFLK